MMTEREWAAPRWELRSVNDRGCSIMAAPGGGDEVGHFLPLRPLASAPKLGETRQD